MLTIHQYTEADKNAWDTYVHNHPQATLYHLSGWKNVIEKTYGHNTYYLMATKEKLGSWEAERLGSFEAPDKQSTTHNPQPTTDNPQPTTHNPQPTTNNPQPPPAKLAGLLPLVHIKHFLFGNTLISVPFLDYGGILADDRETEKALIDEAIKIGRKIGAGIIELRNIGPLQLSDTESFSESNLNFEMRTHKVRMILGLPMSSEELMKSFKSKLRSQIRKPMKEGLTAVIGGVELLDDFYMVFVQNMRDLGSPVHSKLLINSVFDSYPKECRIVVIYRDRQPLACSFVAGFKNTLENPWASSLREYSKLAPNMLLYWTMLEYACNSGFNLFDFGRSTSDEGTYKFKSQWGADPVPLHWYYIATDGNKLNKNNSENQVYSKAIAAWKKLPVPVTRVIGPRIRKYIGL